MHHAHERLHRRGDILDDVGRIIDDMNPFKHDDPSGDKNSRQNKHDKGPETVVKYVYKTMSKTFAGRVGVYKTMMTDKAEHTPAPGAKNTKPAKPNKNPSPTKDEKPKQTQHHSEKAPPKSHAKHSTALPTAIKGPHGSQTHDTVLAKATGQASVSHTDGLGGNRDMTQAPTHATASPSTHSSAKDGSASGGTSAGAKAGIAFGVLGGLFLVGMVVFFLVNRRRKQSRERQMIDDDNEKFNAAPSFGNQDSLQHMPTSSDPKAPRISLRPVTQFLPNWNPNKQAGDTAARGPAGGSLWERPGTSQSSHSNNPFGNNAERVPSPVGDGRGSPVTPTTLTDAKALPTTPGDSTAAAGGLAVGAGAAAAAGAGAVALARKTSMRKDGHNNMDFTISAANSSAPVSPAGTEFSMSSVIPGTPQSPTSGAAAIAAAGGPPNSSVHRVQLDFKPTLDDEMGLRAGDLVRLLHEYDDGWALCIRLDRSQQGVVPRTCLSTRPVKPRPQGGPRPGPPVHPQQGRPRGPPQPGQRPMGPPGRMGPGRPASPAGRPMGPHGRPQSPMGPPMSPDGRPMSPGSRAQSPGPRYQGHPGGRPQSPSGMSRRMSPPGSSPSPMNPSHSPGQGPPTGPVGRKPVPGQAY